MKTTIDASSDREAVIVMSRTLEAPREKVWAALTDPIHVARWFGGHGFTNPVCEMDLRPGGRWRHVMRTPNGHEMAMEYVFVEVVPPKRLVWQHADHGKPRVAGPPVPVIAVTLEPDGARTKWTMVATFASLPERDAARTMGFTTVLDEGSEKLEAIAKAL